MTTNALQAAVREARIVWNVHSSTRESLILHFKGGRFIRSGRLVAGSHVMLSCLPRTCYHFRMSVRN